MNLKLKLSARNATAIIVMSTLSFACAPPPPSGAPGGGTPPVVSADTQRLRDMAARFVPIELGADVAALSPNEYQALGRIVAAARLMDAISLRQAWAGNESLLLEMLGDQSDVGRARLRYFLINKGPWSGLDDNASFVPGVPEKPAQANFYPADATKEEVEVWMAGLSDAERVAATSFFTTIRREPGGRLSAVPYNLEYQGELRQAAGLLREAAELTQQPTLKAFLEKRADAFISNDYFASDVAWMEIDSSIEPTIGPYETYEDGWFGYKAGFEAFIALRDEAESARLQRFAGELQLIENNLPIEPRHRNPALGSMAPIRVVNLVFASGDANRGVHTLAFNLPNDERVTREKGAKRVMLKNSQEAKFEKILLPISTIALSEVDQKEVRFDAFFTHILMHELMHGLGPHDITVQGRATTVRLEFKDAYAAIEEAKADVSGLFALHFLVDRSKVSRTIEASMYRTFLASCFRSIRFGTHEAHGLGIAIQLNYFLDHGGVVVLPSGRFAVNPALIRQNVVDLTRDLMTMQATGDYAAAKELMATLGVVRPEVQRVLDRLEHIPVDIAPTFVSAAALR